MSTAALLAQNAGGIFAVGGALCLIILLLVILATVFWIWMLVDVLISNLPVGEKVLWFLVIFFLHLLGALIYYIVRRQGRGAMQM